MRYYIMKEKRGSLDMSETEGAIISLGMIVFIVIVMAIYLSVVGTAIIITINCGALFRNHGRKFALCFVPVYNLYLCSKILTGKGLVLLGIIATLCVDAVSVFGLLNGNLNFAGVGKVLWTIVTILLVIFHFYLVGYFNCQISRLSGVNEQVLASGELTLFYQPKKNTSLSAYGGSDTNAIYRNINGQFTSRFSQAEN